MDRPGSGLRRLIGLLLVLNAGVLAYGLGADYWRAQPGADLSFNADKIRLMAESRPDAPAPARPAEAAPARPASGADAAVSNCIAWASLDADALGRVEAALAQAGIGPAAYEMSVDKKLGWWVYLPPQPDAAAMRAALAALRDKGVTDMGPVRGGPMAMAISLGAFPSLSRARVQAAVLTRKGVSGARHAPRPGVGEVRLRWTDAVPAPALARLAAAWPAGLRPRACAAAE